MRPPGVGLSQRVTGAIRRMVNIFRLHFVLLIALIVSGVTGVSAQSAPLNCAPPIGANLAEPPQVLVCRFAFPVNGTQSTFQVFNAQGERVDKNDTRNFSRDPELVAITLDRDKMPTGIYTVRWSVLHEAGGAPVSGEFQIGIRTAAGDSSLIAQPVATPDASIQTKTNNTAPDLGGVVLAVSALIGLGGLGIWLWWRRREPKKQGEGK